VARLGGDEFGVVLPELADPAEVEAVAERITAALRRPIVTEALRLDVEGSIGIALYPDHGNDADTLLQRADVAMYISPRAHLMGTPSIAPTRTTILPSDSAL
jgi:diguanylate cyclase (GGDEF)-like protein